MAEKRKPLAPAPSIKAICQSVECHEVELTKYCLGTHSVSIENSDGEMIPRANPLIAIIP